MVTLTLDSGSDKLWW